MTERGNRRTLSIRGWFALAAVTTFVLVVIMVLASVALVGVSDDDSRDRIDRAVATVRTGAAGWLDPQWVEQAEARLRTDSVTFVLFEDGEEVARGSTEPDLPGGAPEVGADRVVRRVEIEGTGPQRTALVSTPLDGDDPIPGVIRATVVIGAIAAAVSLAFGRPFIGPLRAVRLAARRVSEGDMDVRLPRSRITEVDDVVTAFDVMAAELDRSLEQQAELELERRLFIAAIAHDLRTPLFALRGYLEGLETGVVDLPEARARYLAIANEKARTLDRLVSELFDYTRLEYLDQSVHHGPLDLAVLLHDLMEGLRPQAEAGGLTLELWPHEHSCPIEADCEQLTRAVTNLIDNAVRYTPAGGRVDVACGRDDDLAWFTVTDSGAGIDADDLAHLFQPLYRGNRARQAVAGGTGLGLAIAHRIVTAHHGTLVAANSAAGGAVFTATIPVRRAVSAVGR